MLDFAESFEDWGDAEFEAYEQYLLTALELSDTPEDCYEIREELERMYMCW